MYNISNNICTFEQAKKLAEYNLPLLPYVGCTIYNTDTEKIHIVIVLENNILRTLCIDDSQLYSIDIKHAYRAYNSAEIGYMRPLDYTLPMKFEEGWAFVAEDGDVVTDIYYETEAQARAQYLLFFLKHKIIKKEDLTI